MGAVLKVKVRAIKGDGSVDGKVRVKAQSVPDGVRATAVTFETAEELRR